MSKIYLIVSLFVISLTLQANQLPPIPADCFEDENYCYDVGVVFSAELNRKVVRVNFNARLDAGDFENYQEIAELFLDFGAWASDYLPNVADYESINQALKDNDVVMISSEELEPVMINGVEARVHLSHCWSKAPWPLSKVEMVERVFYVPMTPYEGAIYSLEFYPDKTFTEAKGLKHKTGKLHISYDEAQEAYLIYVTVDVISEIDFLPSVAAPYVGKSFVAIFEGVFSQYL